MLRKMLEEMGGSLTSAKLVDGKMIDTTASRLNQAITPQQQSLYEQIKKIGDTDFDKNSKNLEEIIIKLGL